MKYKVGDRVRIKSREWYEKNKNEDGGIINMPVSFAKNMSEYCGKIMTINSIDNDILRMKEDDGRYWWKDDMIEGLAEEKPLDLTEILKDCPKGTKLWSPLLGEVEFEEIMESHDHPIKVTAKDNYYYSFSERGFYFVSYEDAECVLFPSKDQRDWSEFKSPRPDLPIDTLVMVKDNAIGWLLRFYAGDCRVFNHGHKSEDSEGEALYRCIIPVDKFNFEDLEANLNSEYNYGTKGGRE